ncbi:hypothetical protein M406DRAFT_56348 [Cryphonectria parasitica EP155]|uniref:Uncharacterized protein n=1 Tax=Cryphonectria parasitica (strain ATCC 38755 / EP155) TaxID=660469 RepID=A0A9P4Y9F7_CRYP1|nr:uncharacterized protein M406DRAFT_56348 [Cryphonectria parasitica EP155]KAF3768956.1 hypothetical protein M406DRAFT_56348 [Cryphonectria parasitica EP155]
MMVIKVCWSLHQSDLEHRTSVDATCTCQVDYQSWPEDGANASKCVALERNGLHLGTLVVTAVTHPSLHLSVSQVPSGSLTPINSL